MSKQRSFRNLIIILCSLLLCLGMLAGCADDSENKTPEIKSELEEVTNFTLNFDTGDYSFTGVENAAFYYIRIYPIENGVESVSATMQSDRINADSSNQYSGNINYILLAGNYSAQVMAVGSGYGSSYTKISGVSTMLASPTLSANWNTEGEAVTADITITAEDSYAKDYTLTVTNEAGTVVYTNSAAAAGPINLTAADFGVEALAVENVYHVSVTVNPVSGYTEPKEAVTVQITERRQSGPPS